MESLNVVAFIIINITGESIFSYFFLYSIDVKLQ